MEGKTNIVLVESVDYEDLLRAEFERDTILAALKRSVNDRYGLRFEEDELVPVLSALGYDVNVWIADNKAKAKKLAGKMAEEGDE